MKKFLIALNIVIWSIICFEVAHAEPAKKPVAKAKVEKKVEAPKDLGKKPTPKKKISEAK